MMVLKSFNLVLKRYWKSMENGFWKCVGTLKWTCKAMYQFLVLHSLSMDQTLDLWLTGITELLGKIMCHGIKIGSDCGYTWPDAI